MAFGSNHCGAFFPCFWSHRLFFHKSAQCGVEMSPLVFPQTTMVDLGSLWEGERSSSALLHLHGCQRPSWMFWLAYSCLKQALWWGSFWYLDTEKHYFQCTCSEPGSVRIKHGGETLTKLMWQFYLLFLLRVCDKIPARAVTARKNSAVNTGQTSACLSLSSTSKTPDSFACLCTIANYPELRFVLSESKVSVNLPMLQAGQICPGASNLCSGVPDKWHTSGESWQLCSVSLKLYPLKPPKPLSSTGATLLLKHFSKLADPNRESVRKWSRRALTRALPQRNVWVHDWLCLLFKSCLLKPFITSGFMICLIARFPPRLISCYRYPLLFLYINTLNLVTHTKKTQGSPSPKYWWQWPRW